MNLLPRDTILMIENEMIDEAVKKFSDSKEASKYFISSLVTSGNSIPNIFSKIQINT